MIADDSVQKPLLAKSERHDRDKSQRFTPMLRRNLILICVLLSLIGLAAALRADNSIQVAQGSGTLIAPGYYKQAYQISSIDTTQFPNGGTLQINITMGSGVSSGSFDVFPQGASIPTNGPPTGTLGGAYDISPGSKSSITIQFAKGQIFQFGATGNWFSTVGSTNTYSFTAFVTPNVPRPSVSVDLVRMADAHTLEVDVTGSFSSIALTTKTLQISTQINGKNLNPQADSRLQYTAQSGVQGTVYYNFFINLQADNVPRFAGNQEFSVTVTGSENGVQASETKKAVVLLPVVLVPGLNNGNGGFVASFDGLVAALMAKSNSVIEGNGFSGDDYTQFPAAYPTLYALEYNTVNDDLIVGAQKLNALILNIKGQTYADKINLVGYSKGGLVAREYLQFIDPSSVYYCILCATPNTGSVAADIPTLGIPNIPRLGTLNGDPNLIPIYPWRRQSLSQQFIYYPVPELDALDGYQLNGHPNPYVRGLPTSTGIKYSIYYSSDDTTVEAITIVPGVILPQLLVAPGDGIVNTFSALGYRKNTNSATVPDELIPAFQGVHFDEIIPVPGFHAGYMSQPGMKAQLPSRLLNDIN